MTKKILITLAAALTLLCGLFLPDITLQFIDNKNTAPVYSIACPPNEYVYEGTFENRVSAFTAYENLSVNVKCTEKTQPEEIDSLPRTLDGLLPPLGEGAFSKTEFVLSPVSMNARFVFSEYTGTFEKGKLRFVTDNETGKIIFIGLTNAKDALSGWEKTSLRSVESFSEAIGLDIHAVTGAYANLNGYYELNDLTDGNSYGGSAVTAKTDIKGERLQISVTFSAPAGILNYRLIAKGGE